MLNLDVKYLSICGTPQELLPWDSQMEGLGLSLEKDSERKYTRILKKLTLDYGIAMIF